MKLLETVVGTFDHRAEEASQNLVEVEPVLQDGR